MKTVLIVADMLNDFVTGKFGSERARNIVPNVVALVKKAHKLRVPVIFLRDVHSATDRELDIWGEHAMKGSKGSEIIPELKPEKNDIVIEKKQYIASVELPEILKQMNADTLIFTGVSTDICVQNSVAQAYFSGYKTIVPRDCTASIDEEAYEYALKYMKNIFGTQISSSEKVL
jgi:nicotinamidase-related amidase